MNDIDRDAADLVGWPVPLEREAFEEWAKPRGFDLSKDYGDYEYGSTESVWLAWQARATGEAALRARIAEVERLLKIANLKASGTLANNLCPDHRDKQTGQPCLACQIERLRKQRDEAVGALDVLLRAHESLLLDCRLSPGEPTRNARATLASLKGQA